MTLKEVVAILGDPPGNYTTLPEDLLDYSNLPGLRWANDEYCVRVTLDVEGKVADYQCVQSWDRFYRTTPHRSLWQHFRNWLGL